MITDPPVRRGDVWLVDFGVDPEDPEQAFRRPAVVVSDDRMHHPSLSMVIVLPGTSTIRPVPLHVVVGPDDDTGLRERTALQPEQVRAVSVRRLIDRLGSLGAEDRHALDEILRNVLRL